MKHMDSQAGNVFFLILIAIVLLGAFTFSVTRTSSMSSDATSESNKVAASRIISYGSALKTTIDQMRGNGISEKDISFANPFVSGYGTAGTNAPVEVFNIEGGGMTYEKPNPAWLDSTYSAQDGYGEWRFTGGNALRYVGTPLAQDSSVYCIADSTCKELVVILPYVKKDICQAIDNMTGFLVSSAIPADQTNIDFTKFTGTYLAPNNHISTATSTDGTWGKTQGCIEGGGSPAAGSYHYFQVLIAR